MQNLQKHFERLLIFQCPYSIESLGLNISIPRHMNLERLRIVHRNGKRKKGYGSTLLTKTDLKSFNLHKKITAVKLSIKPD